MSADKTGRKRPNLRLVATGVLVLLIGIAMFVAILLWGEAQTNQELAQRLGQVGGAVGAVGVVITLLGLVLPAKKQR